MDNCAIKNIGILAHVDAGKTTLTEQLLYHSGAIKAAGRVDEGSTVTDSMAVERRRGITVKAGTTSFRWRDVKINLLDTPGHMDFISEVERCFSVLDGAVLLLSAREAVQSQTRVIFHMLRRYGIPTLLFVNKIDRIGVELDQVHRQIATLLTADFLPLQEASLPPNGEPALRPLALAEPPVSEAILYSDDALFERVSAGEQPTERDSRDALRRAVKTNRLYPLLYGSALRGLGIGQVLDAIIDFLPDGDNRPDGAPGGYVYKVDWDEKHTRRAYIRMYSGSLRLRGDIPLPDGNPMKVRNLLRPESGSLERADCVPAGDIAVIPGEDRLAIGSIVGVLDLEMPIYSTEKAALQVAAIPEERSERGAFFEALRELSQEDPALHVVMDPEQGGATLHVLGETQLEILDALLRERYNLAVQFGPLRTIYRERPKTESLAEIAWGLPNPYEATMRLRVSPGRPGSGIRYETKVNYGYLQTPFQRAVEEGVRAGCACGLLGWELVDTEITLEWAFYSSVTSTPSDFRGLAPFIVDKALRQTGTVLMEPICRFRMEVPNGVNGKALYDLERMRAIVNDVAAQNEQTVVTGTVPAETSRSYTKELLSYTGGKGMLYLEPAGYVEYHGDPVSTARKGPLDELLRGMFIKQDGFAAP